MAEATKESKLSQYLTEAHGKEKELETALDGPHRDDHAGALQEAAAGAPEGDQATRASSSSAGSRSSAIRRFPQRSSASPARARRLRRDRCTPFEVPSDARAASSRTPRPSTPRSTRKSRPISAIEALAEAGRRQGNRQDRREIRREEERMASFLEKQIPVLTKAVARDEIPAAERNGGRKSSSYSRAGSRSKSKSRSRSRATAAK